MDNKLPVITELETSRLINVISHLGQARTCIEKGNARAAWELITYAIVNLDVHRIVRADATEVIEV